MDGNKRTSWASVSVFYMINGFLIRADQGAVVALVVDAAEGQVDVPTIAATLKAWAQPFEFPNELD
jgi:death-on-curing protein